MERALTDIAQLRSLCNGDTARMERYIRMFLQGTPALFEQLRADLDGGDLESLSRNAHGLKPQATYMGAAQLKEDLQRLEQAAHGGDSVDCASLLERCRELHAEVMRELEGALADL
ncbi:MAG: Hpt domain-containing protein [Flavobacteriales bacterium]|nr:Hpt domain-containing protein [Flavobacteriales bacterium]MCB9168416.1 Hpt domain-containing protein [Flavobacteriales bacterium]